VQLSCDWGASNIAAAKEAEAKRPSRISTLGFTLFIAWVPSKSERPSSTSYVAGCDATSRRAARPTENSPENSPDNPVLPLRVLSRRVFQIQKKIETVLQFENYSRRCFEIEFNQGGCSKFKKKSKRCLKLEKKSRRSSEIKFNQGSGDCSAIMFPTILPRRFAPAANVQSSYLTLSGCQLLSQGGP
jgi:hypothetical protein